MFLQSRRRWKDGPCSSAAWQLVLQEVVQNGVVEAWLLVYLCRAVKCVFSLSFAVKFVFSLSCAGKFVFSWSFEVKFGLSLSLSACNTTGRQAGGSALESTSAACW